MPRPRSGFLLFVLTAVVLASDSPQATFCACGIQVGGTVATSDRGTVVIEFAGSPQTGKFNGTTITARICGRTVLLSRLPRVALPGPGLPAGGTLVAAPNREGAYSMTTISAGTYRINEILV